jgi:MYXO-CTERM domain-containing protein
MKTYWKKLGGALVCSTVLLSSNAFAQTYEPPLTRPGVEMTEPAGADRGTGWTWLGLLGLLGLFGLRGRKTHDEPTYRKERTV